MQLSLFGGNQQRQQLGDAPGGGFVGAGNQQTKPSQRFAWICCRKPTKQKKKTEAKIKKRKATSRSNLQHLFKQSDGNGQQRKPILIEAFFLGQMDQIAI